MSKNLEKDIDDQYLDALELSRTPNFEELEPNLETDRISFIARKNEDIIFTAKIIKRFTQLSPNQVLLISASPGVGKSTFIRFLASQLSKSYYISLFDYSPAFEYNFNIDLTNHHIMRFASHLEKSIVYGLRENRSEQASKLNISQNINNYFEIDDYVIDVLSNLIVRDIDEYIYIFIDNIDFIDAAEQFRIIRIVGALSQKNRKVIFIVCGRPFVTMMARVNPRQFFGTTTHLLHHLPYLSIKDVIVGRFLPVSNDPDVAGKFLDDDAFDLLDNFIDGNIALGLKILADLFIKRPFMRPVEIPTSNKNDLIQVMIGEQLLSAKKDDHQGGNFGFVCDIFARTKAADRIPIVYFILSKLNRPVPIDDQVLSQWNSEIRRIDSQSPVYTNREFREIIETLRGMRLIRRTGIDQSNNINSKISKSNRSEVFFDCSYCITRTGVTTIILSKSTIYEDMASLSHYPTGYRDYIKRDDTVFNIPEQSKPWEFTETQ
uniref:ATP-binding protein n=1 Tax=Pararhizobium sp. IMCC3301 TaxID=3067904 RepID=UPI002741431B|nr:ATP-binding protein [Pararhizobium sp. IMCC3301]